MSDYRKWNKEADSFIETCGNSTLCYKYHLMKRNHQTIIAILKEYRIDSSQDVQTLTNVLMTLALDALGKDSSEYSSKL